MNRGLDAFHCSIIEQLLKSEVRENRTGKKKKKIAKCYIQIRSMHMISHASNGFGLSCVLKMCLLTF